MNVVEGGVMSCYNIQLLSTKLNYFKQKLRNAELKGVEYLLNMVEDGLMS